MKKFYKILPAFILLIFTLASCESVVYIPSGEIPANLSYSEDVLAIFNRSCNRGGCHNSGGVPPDLSPQNGYNYMVYGGMIDTANPENSLIYLSMNDLKNPMPPEGLLSVYERSIVLGWIQQGANNN